MFSPELNMKNYLMDEIPTCRVPQLMSVLLTDFLSAVAKFTVFVEIDFVVID